MPAVESTRPLEISPLAGEVKISNRGPNKLYYGENENVSQGNKIGELSQGESLTISGKETWLIAVKTPCVVDLEYTPSKASALGLAELDSRGFLLRAQSQVQWFNVKDYGAVGNNVADDTKAIEEAKAALKTAGGGVLYFPPSTGYVAKQLTYSENERWVADSTGSTELGPVADLYVAGASPAIFIVPEGGGAFTEGHEFFIENLRLSGPSNAELGKATNKTIAIRLNRGASMLNCVVKAFFAGAQFWGDHQKLKDVRAVNNYYGLDFPDAMPTAGDQEMLGCYLTGNGLASIHISGGGIIDRGFLHRTHLGYSPVGILRTDSQSGWDGFGNPEYKGTKATTTALNRVDMNNVPFEACGNGGILDLSTGTGKMLVDGTETDTTLTFKPEYKTTKAPLNEAKFEGRWAIYCSGQCKRTRMNLESWETGTGGMIFLKSGGVILQQENYPANMFGSVTEWSFAANPLTQVDAPNMQGGLYEAETTIAAGDLLEIGAASNKVKRATATANIFGVALTPSEPGGQPVLVQTGGIAPAVSAIANEPGIGAGVILAPSQATAYKVDKAANAASRPGIGVTTESSAALATAIESVRLLLPVTPRAKSAGLKIEETTVKALREELNTKLKAAGITE